MWFINYPVDTRRVIIILVLPREFDKDEIVVLNKHSISWVSGTLKQVMKTE